MKKSFLLAVFCVLPALGAAGAADCNQVPNRLAGAKPGEWASYMLPGGYLQKLTVVDRAGVGEAAEVTIRVDNIFNGKVVNSRTITEPAGPAFTVPAAPATPGVVVYLRRECVKPRGKGAKPVEISVVEIAKFFGHGDEDNTTTEWWISRDVPVFGIFKKVTDGEVEWELFKHGYDAPAKK